MTAQLLTVVRVVLSSYKHHTISLNAVLFGSLSGSFRDNELKSLLEMRGVAGADMRWVRDSIEGDEVC
jgi:hypothetical protein